MACRTLPCHPISLHVMPCHAVNHDVIFSKYSLAGRYFRMSATMITVKLRNFPMPLFVSRSVEMTGSMAVVQVSACVMAWDVDMDVHGMDVGLWIWM